MKKVSINDMYLNSLQEIGSWTTISDWALKFSEMYPSELEKAEKQASGQKNDTTGLREIAARISSQTSRNKFSEKVEVDTSERPRRVRWLTEENAKIYEDKEKEEDVEPINRRIKEKTQYEALSVNDKFRMTEFEDIIRQLNKFFGTDFELEHAKAIMNGKDPGGHHPDNIQILMKNHNRTKSGKNWDRFSIEEQEDYIQSVVKIQKIIAHKMNIEIEESILDIILDKLKKIF